MFLIRKHIEFYNEKQEHMFLKFEIRLFRVPMEHFSTYVSILRFNYEGALRSRHRSMASPKAMASPRAKQGTLPFKRMRTLPNGQLAVLQPSSPPSDSPFYVLRSLRHVLWMYTGYKQLSSRYTIKS